MTSPSLARAVESLTANTLAEALAAYRAVLVDFWAPWCGPCRALAPVIEEVACEAPEGTLVAKVNVDQQPALAQRFEVQAIPTLLFLRDGTVVERVVGGLTKAEILARLGALSA